MTYIITFLVIGLALLVYGAVGYASVGTSWQMEPPSLSVTILVWIALTAIIGTLSI